MGDEIDPTLNRICLHQLSAVDQQRLKNVIPGHAVGHPQVHVR